MVRLWGGKANVRPLDPPMLESGAFHIIHDISDLTWQLSTPCLTTQYKSFYFAFEDGSAGYIQYAYGNLGPLVKVVPLAFTYYRPGSEPIVASQTYRASQMVLSDENLSMTIGSHSLEINSDRTGWKACIHHSGLTYVLHFVVKSEAFVVHDFGRDTPAENMRHKIIPTVTVYGTVQAHDQTWTVQGTGIYIEAFFMHLKFTDGCKSFTNFQLRSESTDDVLTLLQYEPRYGGEHSPKIAQGSFTRAGRIISVNFDCVVTSDGRNHHEASGYELPRSSLYKWQGITVDGQTFKASVQVTYAAPSSVTDVLSIFPRFFKDIVSIWAGLPYVFCYRVCETTASVELDGIKSELRGVSNTEITMVHRN